MCMSMYILYCSIVSCLYLIDICTLDLRVWVVLTVGAITVYFNLHADIPGTAAEYLSA